MNHPTKPNRGFTIIELMVAMVIIAIASSIALTVSGRELRRERINSATVGLAGWIEEVRRSALKGNPCTITIAANPGAASGTILATAAEVPRDGETARADRCQSNTPFRVPNELSGSRVAISPATTFTFSTLGTLDPPTNERVLELNLIQPGGQVDLSRCIRLAGILGFLEVGNRNGGTCSYTTRF